MSVKTANGQRNGGSLTFVPIANESVESNEFLKAVVTYITR